MQRDRWHVWQSFEPNGREIFVIASAGKHRENKYKVGRASLQASQSGIFSFSASAEAASVSIHRRRRAGKRRAIYRGTAHCDREKLKTSRSAP